MAKRKKTTKQRSRAKLNLPSRRITKAAEPKLVMPSQHLKRQLTLDQEFQIMKLVLDKFLWLGFMIMALGLYICLSKSINEGLYYILAGIIILLLFVWIIVKEFEIMSK